MKRRQQRTQHALRRMTQDRSRRGSILLLSLMISGAVAMMSVSIGTSVRTQVSLVRNHSQALNADLAAQSGLEFARRQMLMDVEWSGMNGNVFTLDTQTWFTATRTDVPNPDATTTAVVVIEGFRAGTEGEALYRLVTSSIVVPPDLVRTKAVISLGEKFELKKMTINGDVLIPRREQTYYSTEHYLGAANGNGNKRYKDNPGQAKHQEENRESWVKVDAEKELKKQHFKLQDVTINGDVYDYEWPDGGGPQTGDVKGKWEYKEKVNGADYEQKVEFKDNVAFDEVRYTSRDAFIPDLDLEQYTQPGDDRTIIDLSTAFKVDKNGKVTNKVVEDHKLSNLSEDKTVVVIMAEEQKLQIEDSVLHGGLVVVVIPKVKNSNNGQNKQLEKSRFDKPKTKVELKGYNVIGGGSDGMSDNIGIIAPDAKIKMKRSFVTPEEVAEILAEYPEEWDEWKNLPVIDTKKKDNAATSMINGLSYVNEFDAKKTMTDIDGQVIAINKFKMEYGSITFDPELTRTPPPGYTYGNELAVVDVSVVNEAYDPVDQDNLLRSAYRSYGSEIPSTGSVQN